MRPDTTTAKTGRAGQIHPRSLCCLPPACGCCVADRSGFFMESLDTKILNTAVPTIAAALHVAPSA